MNIHSFGCSFVAGNGVDLKKEEALGASKELRLFREKNSFTGQLASLLGSNYFNYGKSGSNVNYSLDLLALKLEKGEIKKGDLVIFCFTSPSRNTPEFWPTFFDSRSKLGMYGLSFGLEEYNFHVKNEFHQLTVKKKEMKDTLLNYRKPFLAKYFDFNTHFDYYSQNTIFLLQYLFDIYKINHIFIDAFNTFVTNKTYDKTKYINENKYWNYQKFNMYTFLDQYKDESLFEDKELAYVLHEGRYHPSAKGHKIIAEELYKFYNKLYG